MNISMELHQQILAAARDDALQEAAGVALEIDADVFRAKYKANYNRKRYDVDGLERTGNRCLNIQAEDARESILALRATPAPVSPAVRIAELEAALRDLVELEKNTSPFGGEIQQDRIERAFDTARAALSTQENTDAG